jgi:hypothetical protein
MFMQAQVSKKKKKKKENPFNSYIVGNTIFSLVSTLTFVSFSELCSHFWTDV